MSKASRAAKDVFTRNRARAKSPPAVRGWKRSCDSLGQSSLLFWARRPGRQSSAHRFALRASAANSYRQNLPPRWWQQFTHHRCCVSRMKNRVNVNIKASWPTCEPRSTRQARNKNKEGAPSKSPFFGFSGRNGQRRGVASSIAIAGPSAALHVLARAHRHCLDHSFSFGKQRTSFSNSLAPAERIGFRQLGLGRCIDSIQLHGGPRARKCYCRIVG